MWNLTRDGVYSVKSGYQVAWRKFAHLFLRPRIRLTGCIGSYYGMRPPSLSQRSWRFRLVWISCQLTHLSAQEVSMWILAAQGVGSIGRQRSMRWSRALTHVLLGLLLALVLHILVARRALATVSSHCFYLRGIKRLLVLPRRQRNRRGVIFRDRLGTPLVVATHVIPDVLDPLMAEALMLKWAVDIAFQLGFSSIVFKTDCLAVQQEWYRNSPNLSYWSDVIRGAKHDSSHFDDCSFQFVSRNSDFLFKS
ncbi:hypothetical protein RIF29_10802 [Crotalaria pallida]|uniref:RNase H type-1 domain-containing protein n=1 Tax=Crotalaria pallida TaxID=3830 RepID=A0AAN9FT81_CROPI